MVHPLVYFWIAEFHDGTALPQFDPETGCENKANPDWLPSVPGQPSIPKDLVYHEKRVIRLGWYPFSHGFATLVHAATGFAIRATLNPPYLQEYQEHDVPLLYRSTIICYMSRSLQERGREHIYIIGKLINDQRIIRQIREDGTLRPEP